MTMTQTIMTTIMVAAPEGKGAGIGTGELRLQLVGQPSGLRLDRGLPYGGDHLFFTRLKEVDAWWEAWW